MSTKLVMPSNNLIFCFPFSSCLQSFPASGSFPVSQLFTAGSKSIGALAFSISPSNEYSGWISFRIDWFDLLAVQRTLKNLLQHHNSKASVSFFCVLSLTFVHDYWKNHSFDYKDLCWQSDASVHFFKKRKLVFSNLTKFYRLPSKL